MADKTKDRQREYLKLAHIVEQLSKIEAKAGKIRNNNDEKSLNNLKKYQEQIQNLTKQLSAELELNEQVSNFLAEHSDLINKYGVMIAKNFKQIQTQEEKIQQLNALKKDSSKEYSKQLQSELLIQGLLQNLKKDIYKTLQKETKLLQNNDELREKINKFLKEEYSLTLQNINEQYEQLINQEQLVINITNQFGQILGLRQVYQGLTGIVQQLTVTKIKFSEVSSEISKLITPANLSFKTMSGVFDQIKRSIFEFDEANASFSKNTGALNRYKTQLEDVYNANKRIGTTYKESAEAFSTLYITFKKFSELSEEAQNKMAINALRNHEAFGVSTQVYAKAMETLVTDLGIAQDRAMETYTVMVEEGRKANVPPKELIENFASMGNQFTIFGEKAINIYMKMAKSAKSLGVETSKLLQLNNNLLDFAEASKQAAVMAQYAGKQIISGQQLMMDASKGKGFETLIKKLKETMTWEEMSVFQRKDLANRLKMSVEDLSAVFHNQLTAQQKERKMHENINTVLQNSIVIMDRIKIAWRELAVVIRPFLETLVALTKVFQFITGNVLGKALILGGALYKIITMLNLATLGLTKSQLMLLNAGRTLTTFGFFWALNLVFRNWSKFNKIEKVLAGIGLAVAGLLTSISYFGKQTGTTIGLIVGLTGLMLKLANSINDSEESWSSFANILKIIGIILLGGVNSLLIGTALGFGKITEQISHLSKTGLGVFQKVLPTLQESIEIMGRVVTNLFFRFKGLIRYIVVDGTKGLIKFTSTILSKVIPTLISFMGTIVNLGISIVSTIVTTIIPAIISFVGTVLTGIASITIALLTSPLTWIILGIVGTIGGLAYVIYKFGDSIIETFNSIVDFFGSVWTSMIEPLVDTINTIEELFENLIDSAFDWGSRLIKSIGDGIKSAFDWVLDPIDTLMGKIRRFFPFSPPKEGALKDIMTYGGNITHIIGSGIKETSSQILTPIENTIENSRNLIVNNYKQLNSQITKESLNENSEVIKDQTFKITNESVNHISNLTNKINQVKANRSVEANHVSHENSNINNYNNINESKNNLNEQPVILKIDERVLGNFILKIINEQDREKLLTVK